MVSNQGMWSSDGWNWVWDRRGSLRGRTRGELEELGNLVRDQALNRDSFDS